MKNEQQYKFQIENKNNLIKNLTFKGITLTNPVDHSYTYFDQPIKENGKFTVLRIKESQGKKSVDMKIRNNKTGVWNVLESKIENSEQIKGILESIGCKKIFTFNKKRQTYISKFIRLDLDTTKELGTFLEVKFSTENKKKVEQFLIDLGINITKIDRRSVIEIYLSKK